MVSFLLAFFTFVLVIVCLFVILFVLMQKPSSSGGLGAAMGGGAVESAFGVQTQSVLAKGTLYGVILFFTLAFGLYLGFLKRGHGHQPKAKELPVLEGLAAPMAMMQTQEQPSLDATLPSQATQSEDLSNEQLGADLEDWTESVKQDSDLDSEA